jgi:WD40 repeat protein
VRIVDSATGKPAGPTIDPPGDTVHEVDWSADGSRLMARNLTFNNGGVYVYDPASGDQVGAINGLIVAAALSPDGTKVAYFGEATRADLSVRVVRVDSGDTVATLVGHNSNVEAIAFDRAGDRIATGSDDASARIWDASTGEQLRRLDNDRRVIKHIAFSDDGSFVAVTGNGLAVFNAQTGRQLVFVPGYDAAIAFSPDNRLIAAVGPGDQTVSAVHCDVCVDDVDSLLALADQRITREPTAAERREYLEP